MNINNVILYAANPHQNTIISVENREEVSYPALLTAAEYFKKPIFLFDLACFILLNA